jgi:hypothetical protein
MPGGKEGGAVGELTPAEIEVSKLIMATYSFEEKRENTWEATSTVN